MQTTIYYEIVAGEMMHSAEKFKTLKEAKRHYQKEYKERNKKDGYDEYWKSIPAVIQMVTTNYKNFKV